MNLHAWQVWMTSAETAKIRLQDGFPMGLPAMTGNSYTDGCRMVGIERGDRK